MRIVSTFIKVFIKALVFVLVAFGPSIPIIQSFLSALSSSKHESEVVFLKFAITILSLGTVVIAYWRFTRVSSWESKGLIIFLYWQFIVLPMSLLLAYHIEGISINFFDNFLGAMDQFLKIFRSIFACQIAMQILIILWTLPRLLAAGLLNQI
jgi:hypothetical protein